MILILLGLVFSNVSYGATLSNPCILLMINAGLLGQGELSTQTATSQYIQYLRHFVDQGDLGLEDLKIIRGFSKAPNPIDLFGTKISESYVYHEVIEKLLPFIDQAKIAEELERLISEMSKSETLKQNAYDNQEFVTGALPIVLAPKTVPHSDDFAFDNELGMFAVFNKDRKILHVDTGKSFPSIPLNSEIEFDGSLRTFTRKYEKRNYIARVTNRKTSAGWGQYISVRATKTGTPLIDFEQGERKLGPDSELFHDQDGVLRAFWYEKDQDGKKITSFFYGSRKENITPIPLKREIPIEGVFKYANSRGGLFTLFEQEPGEWVLWDISSGGKEVFSTNLPKNFLVSEFYQTANNNFTIVGHIEHENAGILKDYSFKQTPSKTWAKESLEYDSPGFTIQAVHSFQKNKNKTFYIVRSDSKFTVFKNGVRHSIYTNQLSRFNEIVSSPNSPYIVVVGGHLSQTFYLINTQTSEVEIVEAPSEMQRRGTYVGTRLTLDGRIIAYYLLPHVSNNNLYQGVQLYGPFNPKTGEAVP